MFSFPQRFYAEVLDVIQSVHSASSAGKTTGGVWVRTVQVALPSIMLRRVSYLCAIVEGIVPWCYSGGYCTLALLVERYWWQIQNREND